MFQNANDFAVSGSLDSVSPEARLMWLRVTPQLDFTTVKMRILATRLTQLCSDNRSKALAVHNYVRSLPFACVADFAHTKASDVARMGYGDYHTKGLLFVGLLRALSLPARMRFVATSSAYLTGLLDTTPPNMVHALGEVFLDTHWYQTDTYGVDDALSREARKLLRMENKLSGYGLHAMGDQQWDAQSHAHAQCSPSDPSSLPMVDWGVAHDPAHFYADPIHAHSLVAHQRALATVKKINSKVQQIRQSEYTWMGSKFQDL